MKSTPVSDIEYLNERAPPIKFETIFDGHEISEYREYL